jgi:hypothetical protein
MSDRVTLDVIDRPAAGMLRALHRMRAIRRAAPPGLRAVLALGTAHFVPCSCWRTYEDARDYAYGPGGHRHAMQRDRARGHHRTEYFLSLRPLAERGTLDGAAILYSSSAIRAAATAAPSVSTGR